MQYNENDIDEFGLLKPGLGLYLIALFFCRQIFYYPLIKLVSRKGRGGSGATIDLSFIQINTVWEIVAGFPAILVLLLLFLRKPEAGRGTRTLWAQMKNILLFGAASQTAVLLYIMAFKGADSVAYLLLTLISFYLLYVVFSSERIAQVATEFPKPKTP